MTIGIKILTIYIDFIGKQDRRGIPHSKSNGFRVLAPPKLRVTQ